MVGVPFLTDTRHEEDLVIHRESEEDYEHDERYKRHNRDCCVKANQFFCPSPLEDCNDNAVGGSDRNEVHKCGLEWHEDRTEDHHQQDESAKHNSTDHVGQIFHNKCGEVDKGCGRATDVGLNVRPSGLCFDPFSEVRNQSLGFV